MPLYTHATMSDYNVTFAGIPLESPLIVETTDEQMDIATCQQCERAGAGGVIFPTLTEERLNRIHDPDELTENNREDRGNRDSERVLRRLNTEAYLQVLEETVQALSVPVIASLQCSRRSHWFSLSQQMKEAGAAAIEIRPFQEARTRVLRSDQIEKSILRTTSYVADRLEAPLIVRIPAFSHGLQALVQALADAGAAAVTLEPLPAFRGFDLDAISLSEQQGDRAASYAAFLSAMTASRTIYRRVATHIAVVLPESAAQTLVAALLGGATVATVPIGGPTEETSVANVRRYYGYLKKWMSEHTIASLFDMRGVLSESRLQSSLENVAGEITAR